MASKELDSHIPKFVYGQTNVSIFKEQLDDYFIAYNIRSECKRVYILVSGSICNLSRTILIRECYPRTMQETSYKTLLELLNRHCTL